MDVDIEPILAESVARCKATSLGQALEYLGPFEKQARNGGHLANGTRILEHIVQLCHDAHDWTALGDQMVALSKKRGQMKQAIAAMVKMAVRMVEAQADLAVKLPLIETLRTMTAGKIYVEVERARLTRLLSTLWEKEGRVKEAADVLFELQVETFGSMERGEKTAFLLEQMRLGLLVGDFIRTQIIARKVSAKYLDEEDAQESRLRYYEMMIQLALHDEDYLGCARHYMHIYTTPAVAETPERALEALKSAAAFAVLAPFTPEQASLVHRIHADVLLDRASLYKDLARGFTVKELMRWPLIQEKYFPELAGTFASGSAIEERKLRCHKLQERVMEHNIRIVSHYYQRITLKRLSVLLDTDAKSTEDAVSALVVNKTIYAKLDRPAEMVSFVPRQDPNDTLTQWALNTHKMLDLVVKVNHLIAKEEVVHQLSH